MDEHKYYEQAVNCVKDYVLPEQRKMWEEAGKDFDTLYGNRLNSEMYFSSIIEPGYLYELGYHKCTCPKVLDGMCKDPEHCECTKQSILYILNDLAPEKKIEVEIIETILRGGDKCRFRISVE